MQSVDQMVINAAQLVTCASGGGAVRGRKMQDVGIIIDGAMAIHDGIIVAVGNSATLQTQYQAQTVIDAQGGVVIPGLVDCHTHTPYAGNRYDEFEMRIQGHTYMEIMQAGGGIISTVRQTRTTTADQLMALSQARLQAMMQLGTTTVELKTGYGLSSEAESKQMRVICSLRDTAPMRVVPTFLGAHTIPPEFDDGERYLESIFADVLPAAKAVCDQHQAPFFVDIFVEDGVFTVDQMERYFAVAQDMGLRLKVHADQFVPMGAVPIAVGMGATSVDHLEVTPQEDLNKLAESATVGVMLPAVNFNLGLSLFGDARHLIDAGGILALATDYNPGSSPTISLPLVMAIACRFQKLRPAEALNACTINAAAALKLESQVGSLETGKLADFLILDTTDYRAMIVEFGRSFVQRVFIGGQTVWTRSS